MLENILASLEAHKAMQDKIEDLKRRVNIDQVEAALKELQDKYPNTMPAREIIREKIEEIPVLFNYAGRFIRLFEPSQQVALLDYIIAVLKISLFQFEDEKERILNPKKDEEGAAV